MPDNRASKRLSPSTKILAAPGLDPTTILLSAASYRFFETSFKKVKEQFAAIQTRNL
jgi:hypothetical protein